MRHHGFWSEDLQNVINKDHRAALRGGASGVGKRVVACAGFGYFFLAPSMNEPASESPRHGRTFTHHVHQPTNKQRARPGPCPRMNDRAGMPHVGMQLYISPYSSSRVVLVVAVLVGVVCRMALSLENRIGTRTQHASVER